VIQVNWEKKELVKGNLRIPVDSALAKIAPFVTQERKEKIEKVLAHRSLRFAPVLESIYDRGNISAVMRSAEAFGFCNFHIIETSTAFKESQRVTQGADKWLEVQKWKSSKNCIQHLKESGYKVYTTHLSKDAVSFETLDFSEKTAVVFGNEKEGVSKEALELSDGNVLLPMVGFTQSFNISVAAALSFQWAYSKKPQVLDEEEKEILKAAYYLRSIEWPDKALRDLFLAP
jgi:tRNA (guanosine-2'-O-)-methyltransferase